MTPTRASLTAGLVLAGRYQLEELYAEGEQTVLWRAVDDVLARPVAVRLLAGSGPVAKRFLAAAAQAGTVAHPGLCQVYDAAVERLPGGQVAYVISEWVTGRSLSELLAEGPLAAADAGGLGIEAAEAVAAAHARGVSHGRLHPGNLLVTPAGRVRLTDTAVAAALQEAAPRNPFAADTRDLGALVYAALTGRWPRELTPQPAAGLPAAPRSGTEPYSPRQVRAGVPRAMDVAVGRALAPTGRSGVVPLETPTAFAAALAAAGGRPGGVSTPEPAQPPAAPRRSAWWRPQRGSRLRRALPWTLSGALLLAIGVTTFLVGKSVGQLPARTTDIEALAQPTPTASGSAGAAALHPINLTAPPVQVRDFDPLGDGTESHSTVVNATDKDPSTAWVTEGYTSASLGGVKSGVGLLVDLGRPVAVRRAEVALTTAGADVELRAADTIGANRNDPLPPVVAQLGNSDKLAVLSPPAGTVARYWLVWFTRLPADPGGGYREGIAELALFS